MSWRRLPAETPVDVYVADGWRQTTACQLDDETLELRTHWPPGTAHHIVLDASRYRLPSGVLGGTGS